MKTYLRQFLIFTACFFAGLLCFAQQSPPKPVITKIAKFKPPIVKSYLGVNVNGATVTSDEANQLIALPLKITDSQNNVYPIASYNFLYKRKGLIEDEETGRSQVTFTTVADLFTATPLPKVWIDNIQNGFQKGEEMYFFDIIVKDKEGRKFFAPDLKITIK